MFSMPAESRRTYTYEERCQAVKAVQNGADPSEVSRLLEVPARNLFRWLAWYRSGGWHGLRAGKRSGRPPKVTAEMMSWIYHAVTLNDPRQYKMSFCLWTLAAMRKALKDRFGLELSKSSVSRLMSQLGLSPQRPLYKSYKQDPKQIEKYLKETFPELRKRAKRTGAEIYFVDEAAARSDNHAGRTWAQVGRTPVVEDSGDRFGLKFVSAVSPRGDMRFQVIEGRMNSERFCGFLRKLSSDVGKPLIVICDNATYHVSKKTRTFAEGLDKKVELCCLPKYSPELNPDEQVWNHLKKALGKLFIETKEDMRRFALNAMRSIQKRTSLVRSFFMMKETIYASEKVS